MAKANLEVLTALRNTVTRMEKTANYQWGHMGACNCGFLAQEITNLRKDQIHARAMQGYGDWNDQLNDYCPTSGLPMDEIISQMLRVGFDADDLKHLERLSNPAVLATLPVGERVLRRNHKEDVIKYLRAWVSLIEAELTETVDVNTLTKGTLHAVPEMG